MRILQAFDWFSPRRGGGTVAVVYQLSAALMEKGHEVFVYTSDFEMDREYIESFQGVNVYPFHSWLDLSGFHFTPGVITEARRALKNFDVIHMHCYRSFQNAMLYHYAIKYGIPYVLDCHGSATRIYRRGRKWLFDIILGHRMLRGASRVIAETQLGVNEYEELGLSGDKIILIPPGINTEEFSQPPPPGRFKRKFGIKEKHIVMFLGRLHWIKGIDFLVEAFDELIQRRQDVILVIAGPDDGYRSVLEKLINELNLSSKILLTGPITQELKLAALTEADVLVQTSRYEQGVRVPFEAILCNTPIIVSNNSGAGEYVSKINAGYQVEWGNKTELGNTIEYVLDNPEEAMGRTKKAKEYIEKTLSMVKKVAEYEEVYKKCIIESKLKSE